MPFEKVVGQPPEYSGGSGKPEVKVQAVKPTSTSKSYGMFSGSYDQANRNDINRKSGATGDEDYTIVDGLAKYTGTKYGPDHAIVKMEKGYEFAKEKMKWEGRVRYIRKHLVQCYRREGVNHYKYCKPLVDRYFAELNAEPMWKGKPLN
mmetsp:Transcript_26214/g.63171  ORF Transcript_26214/g.63171 Transcript_26214/m.63171 type:complete len:149 (+) Transcript_26214:127-573(+)|eukprot:CAMPEP_0114500860 /NCGR_PEP_ID=MMETSP0109-20121206/8188_1 /TAXON_ID=29199 /ORGANISM="Chlorarachnion reptans, Strain CCCM449" /LENGTH=148 /DNA_ID=CAMNT_0001678547 /DNA_START=99 /DNA_END=545 /DNA_ORIENTATION=+